jgi:phage virion morphogenesis protein
MLKPIDISGLDDAQARINLMITRSENIKPLLRQISENMFAAVMRTFREQGRPDKWQDLAKSTKKQYAKKGFILEPTLNRRSAGLLSSIQKFVSDTSAGVSTNKKYAAIHNFGGPITRHPFSMSVRLRTDAKGNLLRQGAEGNLSRLAVFAKASHKRAVEKKYTSSGFTINMPKREFMKLLPEDLATINQAAMDYLTGK